jgi:hypothetical protein
MAGHFYTTNAVERDNAIHNLGYNDEGIAGYVYTGPAAGPAPLYRAYHAATDAHFYTMSLAEMDNATNRLGYAAEGIACDVYGPAHAGAEPLYRAYRAASNDHFYTANAAELTHAVQQLGYAAEGVAGYVFSATGAGLTPLFRLVHKTHFYTTSAPERQSAIAGGYTDEGIACYVDYSQPAGPAPLYRARHAATGTHFFTMSIAERDNATNKLGYVAEGIACFIDPTAQPGFIPLHRAYQPSSDDHFYTTNAAELANAVQHLGYQSEGISGYVSAAAGANLTPLYRLFGPFARYLNMTEQHQSQTEWCWSATTVSITHYYDQASTWTQCALVNQAFGQSTCCQNGGTAQCNKPWYGDKALSITGHLASTANSASSLSTVMSQINAAKPISIAIYWNGGGGHNPAIDGYDLRGASGPTVHIEDPWYGPSVQDFNSFPGTYHGGASWGASFFTH